MSVVAHRIRRLTWLVRTPSASSALAQRQALRTELESVLLPALERVFDRYASGDRVLRIPKLMLHVAADYGTMAELARCIEEQLARCLEEQLARSIEEQFPRGIQEQLAAGSDGPMTRGLEKPVPVSLGTPISSPAARHDVPPDTQPESQPLVRHLSGSEHRRDLLIEYLRSGRISWQASTRETPALVDWLQAEAERLVAEQPRGEGLLAGNLETRMATSFRLWQLLTPATRDRWLRSVSLPRDELIAALVRSASNPEFGNYWQLRIAAVLFALRDEELPGLRERHVAEILATWSLPPAAGGVSAASEISRTRNIDAKLPGIEPPVAEADAPPVVARHRATKARPPDSGRKRRRSINVVPKARVSAAIDDDIAWRVRAIDPPPARDVPGLLAADAGLILLHPFLPRLFEATSIVAEGSRALAAESLPRAGALLNWLATGRDTVFEFELSLTKVLLGLTPDDPLPVAEGLLSQGDRDEGDAMLAAVIDHWSALRKTSIAGLRTSFLQRRGMLRDDERGWRLRMETESFDVLLGQLPWGLTVVKLPWMTKPIFTDWPTP